MVIKLENTSKAAGLFEGWDETMIWSCLQGVMGRVYSLEGKKPLSACAALGDFCCFAGKPEAELLAHMEKEQNGRFLIMIPQNAAWAGLMESFFGERVRKRTRYAFKKEPEVFDTAALQRAAGSLPEFFSVKMIDRNLYLKCAKEEWSRDLVSQYPDYESYYRLGLGAAAVTEDGELVSGASSYSSYDGGIEIEVDTKMEYRRRGLALACAARLILECRKRGLYPSWDAHNRGSAALAEKLGYHMAGEYTAYELNG